MAKQRREQVRTRAGHRCEYCQLPESIAVTTFELEHVIAEQHGGLSTLDNLAWCCFYCNKNKGPNIAGIDPATGAITRLFHPRHDTWDEHFEWDGPVLIGKTAEGRTTANLLKINAVPTVDRRRALIAEGLLDVD